MRPSSAAAGLCAAATLFELARGGVPWTPAFFLCAAVLWALKDADGGWKARPAWTIFFAALAAYLSTFRWHGGDDIPNSLLPFSLLRHGTLTLDPVLHPWLTDKTAGFTVAISEGRHLSIFPLGPGLLAIPVYVIPILFDAPLSEPFLHNLSKLAAGIITAASVAVLWHALKDRCSRLWAANLCALYGLGSWSWSVSSQALYQHGPGQLGVSLGLLGLTREGWRWSVLAGLGLGLAVVSRPDSVYFFAAGLAFLLFHRRDRLIPAAAGAAAPIVLMLSYWLYYTGRLRPPESEFQKALFTSFQPEAFFGLILSPTRGLLFFFPLAAFGFWSAWRSRRQAPLAAWMAAAFLGPWIMLCFYSNYVGGNTFGPRYFSIAALALAFACAPLEERVRSSRPLLAAWSFLLVFSISTHAFGGYFNWPGSTAIELEKLQLWDASLHPLVNILAPGGALKGLAPWMRAFVAALLALLAWRGALALIRALSYPDLSRRSFERQPAPSGLLPE